MDATSILATFLILLFCSVRSTNGRAHSSSSANGKGSRKQCNGGNITSLPDGCVIIQETPLIIEGNVNGKLLKKLETIEEIRAGIQINRTPIKNFDFLKKVEVIENSDGYGIIFSRNKHLARFVIPSCHALSGNPKAVYFKQDKFLSMAAIEQNEALGDFAKLEMIAHIEEDYDWYDVYKEPNDKLLVWDALTIGLVTLCCFLLMFIVANLLILAGLVRFPFAKDKFGGSVSVEECQGSQSNKMNSSSQSNSLSMKQLKTRGPKSGDNQKDPSKAPGQPQIAPKSEEKTKSLEIQKVSPKRTASSKNGLPAKTKTNDKKKNV